MSLCSRIQAAGRPVCPTSPSHLPSYCCQGGTRALTPAPSTECPWQGETLLSPPRWVHMLYRQFCAPGEMLRPPPSAFSLAVSEPASGCISLWPSRQTPGSCPGTGSASLYQDTTAHVWAPCLLMLVTYSRVLGVSFMNPLSPSPSPGPVRAQRVAGQGRTGPRRHPAIGLDQLPGPMPKEDPKSQHDPPVGLM